MPLPLTNVQGIVYAVPSGTPTHWSAGKGYTAEGRLCATTVQSSTDVYLAGMRLDVQGRVVVGDGVAAARPYVYNAGLPFDKRNGALIRQFDSTVDSPDEPFVAGVRVGPLGGVYMTTDAP